MSINDFFQLYFVKPLVNPHTEVYNIYNTLAYGLILAAFVFLIFKVLKKLKIPVDRNFFIATLPFIVLASVLRVLRDADILKSYVFVSPLLYFTVFAMTFAVLLATFWLSKLQNKIPYHWLMFLIGVLLNIYFGRDLRVANSTAGLQIFGIAAALLAIIYFANKFVKFPALSGINFYVIAGAMFDASSTFVGVSLYGYFEKHVVPNLLINLIGGAWIMLPLKFFVVLLALYVIDRAEEDEFFRNFLKFAILCITIGPGARNTLRILMGV